ncbi:4175_t:CDS:1 [Cetraspora pellucida]|uniref:4175_t:CDS:1 n=1 Tax=Cetraspora pellucida TaxID=1433469 RepID=A0A9N9IHV9_9GLOM|nr:4175_t:CDS:1 [Cetraspora pellucida]
MVRKNSTISHLIRILNSPESTPKQIQNAFFKYFESTRDYYKCRLHYNKITNEEFNEHDKLLDALKAQIKLITTKNIRLEGRINRLNNKDTNATFLTEIILLKNENHDLIKKNEALKMKNESFTMAFLNSAVIYSNNENQYESTIKQQANVINKHR